MTHDPEQQIAEWRHKLERGEIDQALFDAAVAGLRGPATHTATTISGAIAQGPRATAVGAGGVLVYGDVQGNIYTGQPTDDPAAALQIYRKVLVSSSGRLPLRGVDVGASDPGQVGRQLGLAHVYVDLDTTTQVQQKQGGLGPPRTWPPWTEKTQHLWSVEVKSRPLPAREATLSNRRLILTGDPGSGKSTFVNHLAHCLAAHSLEPEGGWLAQLPGWPEDEATRLPLVVTLRDFASRLPAAPTDEATPQALWEFVARRLAAQKLSFAAESIENVLEGGGALVLFDGLDEVPTVEQRIFVRDAVKAFAERYPDNRYLVTCRVLSYQPPPPHDPDDPEATPPADLRLPVDTFPTFELASFDETKIDNFVDAWYAELARMSSVRAEDVAELVSQLKAAVRRPDLWRLAPNPLLLTVMALVHAHRGRLPDARAFCTWLTERGHVDGWLAAEMQVILPSEAEWEKGTRGGLHLPNKQLMAPLTELPSVDLPTATQNNLAPQRRYPWGNDFHPEQANYAPLDIDRPSVVGAFPGGASPYGLLEMSGNVFEWLRSQRKPYPYDAHDGREEVDQVTGISRLRLRGGSFPADREWLRVSARFRDYPVQGLRFDGVRVVVSPFFRGAAPTSDL